MSVYLPVSWLCLSAQPSVVMAAEVVKYFFPKLVDLHNYIPAHSTQQKLSNWSVLNRQEKHILEHILDVCVYSGCMYCRVDTTIQRLHEGHTTTPQLERLQISQSDVVNMPTPPQSISTQTHTHTEQKVWKKKKKEEEEEKSKLMLSTTAMGPLHQVVRTNPTHTHSSSPWPLIWHAASSRFMGLHCKHIGPYGVYHHHHHHHHRRRRSGSSVKSLSTHCSYSELV